MHLQLEIHTQETLSGPVAPVAYQVVLKPGMVQFGEFEFPRVHTQINSQRLFFCAQIDLRKALEREFATVDEKFTSSGLLSPMRDEN